MDQLNFQPQGQFCLEGRFLGFIKKSEGKLKYLRMALESGELQVKLPKESRVKLHQILTPGDRIQVCGKKKQKLFTDVPKLKAYQVNKINGCAGEHYGNECFPVVDIVTNKNSKSSKAKILICQKSGCIKRGGKKLYQELEAALGDRGLQDQVIIQSTGCLKCCASAPNVILMPGKVRCSKMPPQEIADMLAKQLRELSSR